VKKILFFAFLCLPLFSLYAKTELLPTATELRAMQQQKAAETQKLIAEGKLVPVDGKTIKVNIPRLEKSLIYLADKRGKSYVALSPSAILNGSENKIEWEATKNLNPISFKAYATKNKASVVTVNAEAKKDGHKVLYIVSKDEFQTALASDPKITIVAVDKKTKSPVDGEVKVQ
jgi:hypothetical protein